MTVVLGEGQEPDPGVGQASLRGPGIFERIALLRESPIAILGLCIILFWVAVAILAPLLAPFSPTATIQPMARALVRAEPAASSSFSARISLGATCCRALSLVHAPC